MTHEAVPQDVGSNSDGEIAVFTEPIKLIQPENELNAQLFNQVEDFLAIRGQVLVEQGGNAELIKAETEFLNARYRSIIAERNRRADEHMSPEVQEAIRTVDRLFKMPFYGASCIDSRVARTIAYGIPMGPGGFIRVEAGDIEDFVQGQGPELVLLDDSYFEKTLDEALRKDGIIIEAFDSHLGCAARKRDETAKTLSEPADEGLFADVSRKKKMISALKDHLESESSGKYKDKRVITFQTSFNPHDGYMYMGLERDEAMSFAVEEANKHARRQKHSIKHAKPVYTGEVISKLVEAGKVIHTKRIVEDPRVSEIFDQYFISNLDWRNNYVSSMREFWSTMEKMVDEGILDIFKDKIKEVYSDLQDDEIESRSMALLSNAFNAYTLTRANGSWPYSEHQENCFVITENENGPYAENPSFGIFVKSTNKLSAAVTTTETLNRGNRKAGRIMAPDGTYVDLQAYVEAPVLGVLKVAIKGEEDIDWDAIRNINWKNLPSNWRSMPVEEIINDWEELDNIPNLALKSIRKMLEKMLILTDPRNPSSASLLAGRVVVLPVFVDKYTRIQSVASGLVYKGYRKK